MPKIAPARMCHRGQWMTLEPLSVTHLQDLGQLAVRAPESWEWLPFGPFRDTEHFAAYARFAAVSRDEVVWVVRPHKLDGTPSAAAGWLGLLAIQPAHGCLELGNVWFPPGLSRTRSATEATALLLRHVFDDLGYLRITWKCDSTNTASRRAAERLGFRYKGTAQAHIVLKGLRRDAACYAMLHEEWLDRRSALSDWLRPANFDSGGNALSHLRCTL